MSIPRLVQYAIVLLLAAPALAAGGTPKPATPLANPGDWVSSDDYPPAALHNNMEGVSRFILTIDPGGIVANCRISISSGSSELDVATCRLITDRARFEPARNARGKPITGSWASSVRWQIPKMDGQYPPMRPGLGVRSYLVDPDGKVSDCRVEKAEGSIAMPDPVGPFPCPSMKFSRGYLDENGNPVRKRVRNTSSIEIFDEAEPTPPASPAP